MMIQQNFGWRVFHIGKRSDEYCCRIQWIQKPHHSELQYSFRLSGAEAVSNLNRFSKGLNGTEVMISGLKKTAGNSEIISEQLIVTMNKINRGEGTLGRLIQDPVMAENFNQILIDLKKTSKDMSGMDTTMAKLKVTIGNAEIISQQLTEMMSKINKGNGTIGRLIRDTTFAENLNQTLINLKKGSKGLDENMTAVKHNFLFKGYFNRKEKAAEKKEEAKQKDVNKKQETSK